MAVCVLDAESPLGTELCRALGAEALPVTREQVDFFAGEQVFRLLMQRQPSAVVNTASYSDVELAENEPERCFAVNAATVKRVVEACALLHCPVVNLSTDQVFGADSGRTEPYRETDPTCPRSVFAHSKRAGEVYTASWHRHFIVRTADLYGRAGCPATSDPLDLLVQRCRSPSPQGSPLTALCDQFCTPTYLPHVARAILHLLQNTESYGTYHVVNSGFTNWFDFAGEVCRLAQFDVVPQPTTRAESGVSRLWPAFAALDPGKYQGIGGPPMPSWQAALSERLAPGSSADSGPMPVAP